MRKEKVIGKYIYSLSFLIIAAALFSVLALAQDDAVQDDANITNSGEETSSQIPGNITRGELSQPIPEQESSAPSSNEENILDEDEKEFKDAKLEQGAGITPDSVFYFIDKFFDRFGSDLSNREERVAEIKAMIQAGKIEEAKEALRRYKEYAKKVESEIDPEHQNEARRSAVAIKKTIEDIEGDIPEGDKEEFNEVIESEGRIAAAAKVANKIKELCETLSKLDPQKYAQVCKVSQDDTNVPRWQRNLDKKLTKEQEQEAEKFFEVMSHCFKEPATCQCDQITVPAFAEKCGVVAPLAAKCKQGDDESCKQMDENTQNMDDLLPEHLQQVMARVEQEFGDAEIDNHMPSECKEAGINAKDRDARKKCEAIMFKSNAPEECVKAYEEGKIDISSPKKSREQCEEIMFRENAPQECIDAGIKDFKECGKFMFKQNAPQECVDAGLTGESPRDGRKCEEIMRLGGERGMGPGGRGPPAFGRNCKDIQDSAEKIKCLEEFYNAAQQGGFPGQGGPGGNGGDRGGFPPECEQAGARTQESCEKIMREKYGDRSQQPQNQPDYHRDQPPSGGCDCSTVRCEAGSYPSCQGGSSSCECITSQQPLPPPPTTEQVQQPPTTTEPAPDQQAPLPSDSSGSGSGSGDSGGLTGMSTSNNRFVQYYFKIL